jgi:hypothetical protein
LSFSLGDIRIPDQNKLIADAREQVEGISNYNMGLITITNVTTKLLMLDICKCSIDRISNEKH